MSTPRTRVVTINWNKLRIIHAQYRELAYYNGVHTHAELIGVCVNVCVDIIVVQSVRHKRNNTITINRFGFGLEIAPALRPTSFSDDLIEWCGGWVCVCVCVLVRPG